MSRSSGPASFYKISGSDPDSTLYISRPLMMAFGPGDDGSVFLNSAQDVSKLIIDGDYILKKRKDTKGSKAWQQFQIMFNPVNSEEVFGVACCCLCKVCILYKKKMRGEEISLGTKNLLDHLK